MKVEEDDLQERYGNMETGVLLDLYHSGTLTDLAGSLLRNELQRRGLTESDSKPMAQPVDSPQKKSLVGLGGWLVLPLLGLGVTLVGSTARFLIMSLYIIDGTFGPLTTPGYEYYHPLWVPLLVLEIIKDLLFLVAAVSLLWLAFRRARIFPLLMICFLIVSPILVFVEHSIFVKITNMPGEFEKALVKILTPGSYSNVIWVLYFLLSRRVEQTFKR